VDFADLGDEDDGEDRSDAGTLLDGVVAGVVVKLVSDRVRQCAIASSKALTR
jgi:hypothetical protein